MKSLIVLSFFLLSISTYCSSQPKKISNGVSIPSKGEIKVFVVFAEIDFSKGPCPCNDLPDNLSHESNWPVIEGITQVPADAHTYFNPDVRSFKSNPAFITDLYYEASFGSYKVLGDYYSKVISIPCNEYNGGDGVNLILNKLNEEPSENETLKSSNGLPLKAFDQWTSTNPGVAKINKPDGKLDILYIIWKNNRFLNGCHSQGYAGYGLSLSRGLEFKDMKGINTRSSFNAVASAPGGYNITLYEYMHGIFGGNHWHSGGGAGNHTFLALPLNYGLTAQSGRTMNSASSWDRWMMDYKHPKKKFLISAINASSGQETDTELINLKDHPEGGTFILRDFVTTGDAIRIKFPFIDYEKDGIKNQYLWLENRTMKSRFEKYTEEDCSDYGGHRYGTPGVYAYIQVGKDVKEGESNIYSSYPFSLPNALGSFILPFTAEGNFDFCYRYDLEQEPEHICGNWLNRNVPIDKSCSKPNPFTGFSDVFQVIDNNEDGVLYNSEIKTSGLSEVVSLASQCNQELKEGNVCHNYNCSGDWEDAFGFATGKTKISISSNPASVPAYTFVSGAGYGSPNKNKPAAFENRTIWLNGLSIEILKISNQKKYGTGAVKVKIRWDDYNITEDVRWCGNIALSPHHKSPDAINPQKVSLNLKQLKTIHLDKGQSPTHYIATGKDSLSGDFIFTKPTVFTCLSGAWFFLEESSTLLIDNGSILKLEKGSRLEADKNARIKLTNGSKLIIEKGAEFLTDSTAIIEIDDSSEIIRN